MFDSFTKALSAQLQHDRLKAISFMLLASFCFSLGLLFSKFVVHDTNHAMIVFVRSVFAAFLLTPFLIKKPGGSSETKSNNRVTWLNFVEGLIGCLSTLTILLAISYMSMPEVTSITNTTPVFAILLSAVLLGEGMTLRSFLAIMVSFLALIILLKPEGDKMLNMGGVYALITALLWASRTVIGKILNVKNKQDKAFILFYTKLFTAVFASPLIVGEKLPELTNTFFICASSAASILGNFFLLYACILAPVRIVTPLYFSEVIFSSILSYIFFGEELIHSVFIGAVMVLFAVLILVNDKDKLDKGKLDKKKAKQ